MKPPVPILTILATISDLFTSTNKRQLPIFIASFAFLRFSDFVVPETPTIGLVAKQLNHQTVIIQNIHIADRSISCLELPFEFYLITIAIRAIASILNICEEFVWIAFIF